MVSRAKSERYAEAMCVKRNGRTAEHAYSYAPTFPCSLPCFTLVSRVHRVAKSGCFNHATLVQLTSTKERRGINYWLDSTEVDAP